MNHSLLSAVATDGMAWSLTPCQHKWTDSERERPRSALLLALTMPDGAVLRHYFDQTARGTVENMLAVLFKEHAPAYAGYRRWLEGKGNKQVILASEDAGLYVGESMHVGLRKLADSPQSGITWNALHHMASADRIALWGAVQAYLKEQFAEAGQTCSRRTLAKGLQAVVTGALDAQRYVRLETLKAPGEAPLPKRKREEEFALMAMQAACALTEIDEWMHGWLGYVVTDAPVPASVLDEVAPSP